ncbi:MAG: cation diffusion facilitator family transporter [Magnetococcales bacterium]|nr:cation diffusion facilitator family transporter [Magnetococcales bacterium]MBF0260346.1 cation diffusion facilitator family transporter [Magnetococcales bacterium]
MFEPLKQVDNLAYIKEIEHVGWMAIGVNILLIFLNAVTGWISGSSAVMAEAVHNCVDLIGSVGVVAGLRLSRRKSVDFPYGLYKIENLIALIIGLLIFLTGYEIAKEAIFSPAKNIEVTWSVLVGVVLSLVIPVMFSVYQLKIGKLANSPSLIAAAEEFRSHAFSSGAVLLGVIGQFFGWNLDRWASLLVVVFIGMTGWELIRSSILALLDVSLDGITLQRIKRIMEQDPLTVEVKSILGRNAGRYRFVEAELNLRTNNLEKAEIACRRIEEMIRREIPYIERVLIRNTHAVMDGIFCVLPVDESGSLLEDCFCHAHRFFLCSVSISNGKFGAGVFHDNPWLKHESGRGIQIGKWLIDHKVDIVLTRRDVGEKGLSYVLSDAGVTVHITKCEQIEDALEELVHHTTFQSMIESPEKSPPCKE